MFIKEILNSWDYGRQKFEVCTKWIEDDDYTFCIYTDTLNIPVFHVIPSQDYKDICVCLFEPRYYQYTQDKYYYDHFVLEEFDKVLREPNDKNPTKTNWEQLVDKWFYAHDDIDISKDNLIKKYGSIDIQPDYTKLEDRPIIKRSFARMIIAKMNA